MSLYTVDSSAETVQPARSRVGAPMADVFMTAGTAERRGAMPAGVLEEEAALDITFVVSCYNESEHIVRTLETVCAAAKAVGLTFEVIVVDDGSKDDSTLLVRRFIEEHPGDNVILRANRVNRGLAQNYIDTAFLGKGKYYRLVTGDTPESVENMITILSEIGSADCIVPYYLNNRGRTELRRYVSNGFTAVINLLTGNNLQYYNGLTIHHRMNVQRWHTNTKGFGFQAEILCLLIDLGKTYKEVRIDLPMSAFALQDRQSGALNLRNFLSVMHTILEIAFRRLSHRVYDQRRR